MKILRTLVSSCYLFLTNILTLTQWVQNPFISNNSSDFSTREEKQRTDRINSNRLFAKNKVSIHDSHKILEQFNKTEFPRLSIRALKILIPFANSYVCKAGSSAVTVVNAKYGSRFDVEKKMKVAVSPQVTQFIKPCNKQATTCFTLMMFLTFFSILLLKKKFLTLEMNFFNYYILLLSLQ